MAGFFNPVDRTAMDPNPVFKGSKFQSTPDQMVEHSRQIGNPATPNQDNRIFLERMSATRNIGYCAFPGAGNSNLCNLSYGGVGFFRFYRSYLNNNGTFVGATPELGTMYAPWLNLPGSSPMN
jgi:hypothetical protein